MISGFRVSWDSRRPPGQRVLGVWLVQEPSASSVTTPFHSGTASPAAASVTNLANANQSSLVDIEEVKRTKEGRKYKVVTREYMAEGHDGFTALKGKKFLVDDEAGQIMSSIVRKYLLGEFTFVHLRVLTSQLPYTGCRFVNRMSRMESQERIETLLNSATNSLIHREQEREERYQRGLRKDVVSKWRHAAHLAYRWSRSHYKDVINVTSKEHMSDVDCFDGSKVRVQPHEAEAEDKDQVHEHTEEDLATIQPVIDGRLKDEGRS